MVIDYYAVVCYRLVMELTEGDDNLRPSLYAEQLSGSAFTSANHKRLRSWLYRIHPSVLQGRFSLMDEQPIDEELSHLIVDPNAIRWSPIELTALANGTDFVRGLKLIASCGATGEKKGISIYNYACNISMTDRSFSSADGDLLIVPQQGSLLFQTELGHLSVAAGEIVVVPRGVRFSVGLSDSPCRGRFEN